MLPLETPRTSDSRDGQLVDAFRLFSAAADSLQSAYDELRQRTEMLDRRLQETNSRLRVSLAENERVRRRLSRLLERLPCGVVVIDREGRVETTNRYARELVELDAALVAQLAAVEADGDVHRLCRQTAERGDVRLAVSAVRLSDAERLFIVSDVTERERLEAASRRKSRLETIGQMAAELAHQVRNPLASVTLFAELLQDEIDDRPEAGRLVGDILESSRSLDAVVQRLLDHARMLEVEPVVVTGASIRTLLERLRGRMQQLCRERGVRFTVGPGSEPTGVRVDTEMLFQALLNLLHNALESLDDALPDGYIALRCRTEGEVVRFEVEDSGRGIDAAALTHVFEPFYTTRSTGTGLGLSLVRSVAEQHGGRVGVDSQVGVGSRFWIELPCAAVPVGVEG